MNDNDLSELDALFDEIGGNEGAETVANSFNNLPDGTYDAEVNSAEFKHSKSDLPMIQIQYAVEGGKKHNQFLMLANKDGDLEKTKSSIARAVTTLKKFGLEEKTITDYVAKLDQLVGRQVTIELTTSAGGYQNTHVEVK